MSVPPTSGRSKRPLSQKQLLERVDRVRDETLAAMKEKPYISGVGYFRRRIREVFDEP